MTGLKVKTL